jgi:endonuclease/exonuclease/phosphatase family metal-dependent hydrolase
LREFGGKVAFRAATFNAGLAVGILPYTTERLPHVVDALAALDVDLLFVQEFWLDSHWQALRTAVRAKLPHALRPQAALPSRGAVCTEEQLAPLVACAKKHCAGLRDEALARCVIEHCAAQGFALPSECLNCIASHPSGTLEQILARCLGAVAPTVAPAPAPGPAPAAVPRSSRYDGLIAYGGSFGTGLLSRAPLTRTETLAYYSTVNARGAVYARVDAGTLGEVNVFGTHFSPGGAEQGTQVDELLAWIDSKGRETPVMLLGDLNTAPGSSLFGKIRRAGFREPDVLDTRATFGAGLGTGHVSASGWRIDHVLVRNADAHITSRRILDVPVKLNVGRGVRTTLSDHFGVLAILE